MDTIRKSKTQNLIAGLAIMLISGILYIRTSSSISAAVGGSAGGDFTGVFLLCAALCAVPVVLMLLMRRFCLTHGGKKI